MGSPTSFSFVITSSQFGRRKPDASIFQRAAFFAGAPTSKCAYVGDRVTRDIDGARKAGYKLAIQIVHDFAHGEQDEGEVPDAVIQHMGELPQIIAAENNLNCRLSRRLNNPIKALLFDAGDILYFRPNRGRSPETISCRKRSDRSPDGEASERNKSCAATAEPSPGMPTSPK
jgi:hypothetical protein